MLTKAASFGKAFLPDPSCVSDLFVQTCKTIRVMHESSSEALGIPLTITQYKALTPEKLVSRLSNRHSHLIALKICESLSLSKNNILIDWACAKIKAAKTSQTSSAILSRTITSALAQTPGMDYTTVAKAAWEAGLSELARALLDAEIRSSVKVPLLLEMRMDDRGLDAAIQSGDSDLIHLALLHLKRVLNRADFLKICASKPSASAALLAWAKQYDESLVADFYYSIDERGLAANLNVKASLGLLVCLG